MMNLVRSGKGNTAEDTSIMIGQEVKSLMHKTLTRLQDESTYVGRIQTTINILSEHVEERIKSDYHNIQKASIVDSMDTHLDTLTYLKNVAIKCDNNNITTREFAGAFVKHAVPNSMISSEFLTLVLSVEKDLNRLIDSKNGLDVVTTNNEIVSTIDADPLK